MNIPHFHFSARGGDPIFFTFLETNHIQNLFHAVFYRTKPYSIFFKIFWIFLFFLIIFTFYTVISFKFSHFHLDDPTLFSLKSRIFSIIC